jgi:hypothetical protein
MGGGLMQLVAYGAQDIYLTGNPQITFFKVVYRRHTNFSMETIQQTINGNPTSNSSSTVIISRNGDLVGKVYVVNSNVAVIDGSQLVSEVELEIGGQLIDRHYKEWMDVWNELTTPESKSLALKIMQGAIINQDNNGVDTVQVPLQFWFCRNPGLALPLIALQYHEVKLKFTWGDVSNNGDVAGCEVWVDYIYLDTDERRRFAQVSHEYLIEQLQIQEFTLAASTNSLNLTFNHPVKELIWTNVSAVTYTDAKLVLNGHDRFAAQKEEYFQLRQPYDYHTAVPRQNFPKSLMSGITLAATTQEVTPSQIVSTECQITITGMAGTILFFDGTDGDRVEPGDILVIDNTITAAQGGTVMVTKKTSSTTTVSGSATTGRQFDFVVLTGTTAADLPMTVPADGEILDITLIRNYGSTVTASTSRLSKSINVYSFALKPEEHQPSGTCNFSRIDNAKLELGTTSAAGACNVYAVNYNVLRIMSGMGGLAYSN